MEDKRFGEVQENIKLHYTMMDKPDFLSPLISAVESGLSDFIINYHVNSPTNFY